MTYLAFREALLPFRVFSTRDIEKLFPNFSSRRLVEWQEKGYIRKLVNKWYLFSVCKVDELLLFRISNCIYRPSYISLESALSYHRLIPEGVYLQKAVATRKTITYSTPVGNFAYQRIRPELFFGYTILHDEGLPVLMADLEKALLDYLYLNPTIRTGFDIEQLRLNYAELNGRLDMERLGQYQALFGSKTVDQRVKYLKISMEHA